MRWWGRAPSRSSRSRRAWTGGGAACRGAVGWAPAADGPGRGAPAEVVQDVLERTDGRLDVIVNNAASFVLRPFGEFSLGELDQVLAVNVRAAFFLVQEALPALERSDAPCVVNVSSAAARMYRPGQAAYALSKAALEHLTKQLAA